MGARDELHWVGEGLHFSCTMCGACCTGPPGYVLYTDEDLANMCARLGVSEAEFIERYTHDTVEGRSLNEVETEHGYDCVFLDRETIPGKAICSIHEDRPTQCRTFPWWPEHVHSKLAWQRLKRECEGCERMEEGSFIPRDEIVRKLREQDASRGFE
ncbi:MAG: YkgJ family cysteine cluster protein [Phycisphaerales bacterium]